MLTYGFLQLCRAGVASSDSGDIFQSLNSAERGQQASGNEAEEILTQIKPARQKPQRHVHDGERGRSDVFETRRRAFGTALTKERIWIPV